MCFEVSVVIEDQLAERSWEHVVASDKLFVSFEMPVEQATRGSMWRHHRLCIDTTWYLQ